MYTLANLEPPWFKICVWGGGGGQTRRRDTYDNYIHLSVVVSIAGCSLQIVEATEPPNFASVPMLLHLL